MDMEGIAVVSGDVCVSKQRRKRQKLLATEQLYDYAKNTTLHGLRYVTDRDLSLVERIFWLITFIASVVICFYLIGDVWVKWKTSPVLVTISEQLVPVEMVPFPSLTICPQTKTNPEVYNYTAERYKVKLNMPEYFDNKSYTGIMEKIDDVAWLCGLQSELILEPERLYANASTIVKHILEVSPDLDDLTSHCVWHRVVMKCDVLFSKVLTQEGVCFNMNALAAEELFRKDKIHNDYDYINSTQQIKGWSISKGYEKNQYEPYPRRGRQNGPDPDLMVYLKESSELKDKLCNALNSGYKVYIHHPTDFPQYSLHSYGITYNHVSSLALSYSIISTSEKLKEYTPEMRKCYFPTERYLRYFRIYTANNCRMECITNYTFEQCGCVGYYMPHENSSRICTIFSSYCMRDARELLARQESSSDIKACNCLPACDSIEYDGEIFPKEFNRKNYLKTYFNTYLPDANKDFSGIHYSKLEVYFKKPEFMSMRRSELFGKTDFLANCGGLLGLFLGFSFLSIIEIIYFITLRLWCTLKRDLEEEKTI